jgi:signal transduction histidine kinase
MMPRPIAARLSLMVAGAGLLPILTVGLVGIQLLARRSARVSQDALHQIAGQAAARVGGYLDHQRSILRAIAAVAEGESASRRVQQAVLDEPSLQRGWISGGPADLGTHLTADQLRAAAGGQEQISDAYLSKEDTPAIDLCVPARLIEGHAICAQVDLLELWRLVQHIKVGETGYALAFDQTGRLLAAGAGRVRAAVLTGDAVPETPYAKLARKDPGAAPLAYVGANGEKVLAGWASLPKLGWTVVVEQSESEALASARAANRALLLVILAALVLSVAFGGRQAQRVLAALELEERWRTAGRIATGITHDLGHRLRILQQTAALAEAGNPTFLPRIRENLQTEVTTLQRFVAEFSDLSRDVTRLELLPLEINAFVESVRRTARPHLDAAGLQLGLEVPAQQSWVRADRHLLERALLNLVMNAIEASSKGELAIRVRAAPATIELEVSDQGAGIDPERLATLFDAFRSTKRTGAHVGMGLANVKRIIDAHGGQVSVESVVGQGTRFRITLPRIEASTEVRAA